MHACIYVDIYTICTHIYIYTYSPRDTGGDKFAGRDLSPSLRPFGVAAAGRRRLYNRRTAAAKAAMALGLLPEGAPCRTPKVKGLENFSAGLPAAVLGSSGPPGGTFNLVDCSANQPYTTRSVSEKD